ncbi:hypothetical protein [Pedosphaera parvula]|uniref:Uncharacterized protein n=1 Tax=Pedosphaera parvula (strain Ellin514) TaxID=320771 RepID=B9XEP7_PEDPL|nr:hypothetical protein [Pedosphaera parvula]EEF61761.1 hypothetical protein Cflav_PD4801 [Pedosphaera parvula Ellin514]
MNSKAIYLILKRASRGETPEQIGVEETMEEVAIYAELVKWKYLN